MHIDEFASWFSIMVLYASERTEIKIIGKHESATEFDWTEDQSVTNYCEAGE